MNGRGHGHGGGRGHGGEREQSKSEPGKPLPPSSRLRYEEFRRKLKEKPEDKKDEEKKDKPATKQARRKYLREYWRWLRPYRWGLVLLFFLAVLGTGLGLVQPLFYRYIVDRIVLTPDVLLAERLDLLGLTVGLLAALMILAQGLEAFRSFRMVVLNSKIMVHIRRSLFHKMVRLPLKELMDMKVGGAISRLSSDVNAIGDLVQMAIITPALALLQLAGALTIVLVLNWRLGLVVVVMFPLMTLASYLWVRRVRPIFRTVHEDHAVVSGRLTETFGGIRVVRTFQREHKEEMDYAIGHHTIIRKDLFARLRMMIMDIFWHLLMGMSRVVIIGYGGYLVINDQASVGDMFAFQAFLFMVLQPIFRIVSTITHLQRSLAAMERVGDILEHEVDKPDAPDAVPAPDSVWEMRFNDVCFGYDPEKPVIHNFNLVIEGSKTVAIVGRSGAGKTTIIDLIARFYDPDTGTILVNGEDLRKLQLESYRRLIGIVQQEVFLFDGTVRENIAYGKPKATEEAILAATRRANAHEFIVEFEHGYDTIIGERGVKLSGGQRQRLSIARAFLADPGILILDEATSSLDTESEQLIQASLKELMRDRTTFVIAHRLSTITYADLIVVMDDGRIVETGSHTELLERKGKYYEMIERQGHLTV